MRERVTRSRQALGWLKCTSVLTVSPYTFMDWGEYAFAYTPAYESIKDVPNKAFITYRPGVRRQAYKAVLHEKWTCYASTDRVTYSTDAVNRQTYNGCCVLADSNKSESYARTHDLALQAWAYATSLFGSVDQGHYDRWKHVKPGLATRANLGVFLAELRDFKRMWNILPQKHFSVSSWRDVVNYVNGQHLNYNFGWKPFLGDCVKLHRGIVSYEERLSRFLREADRDIRRRRADQPQDVKGTVLQNMTNPFYRRQFTYEVTLRRASAFDYIYQVPSINWDEMQWRAWLDTVGLKGLVSGLWAITPFSFVCDWFVDIGGALESLESDWLEPWIHFQQACYSRKAEGFVKMDAKTPDSLGGTILPGVNLSFSQYCRYPGLPKFSAATDPLDADKIRLGSSLLISQFMGKKP